MAVLPDDNASAVRISRTSVSYVQPPSPPGPLPASALRRCLLHVLRAAGPAPPDPAMCVGPYLEGPAAFSEQFYSLSRFSPGAMGRNHRGALIFPRNRAPALSGNSPGGVHSPAPRLHPLRETRNCSRSRKNRDQSERCTLKNAIILFKAWSCF